MQKVEGSSPFSRSSWKPRYSRGFFVSEIGFYRRRSSERTNRADQSASWRARVPRPAHHSVDVPPHREGGGQQEPDDQSHDGRRPDPPADLIGQRRVRSVGLSWHEPSPPGGGP